MISVSRSALRYIPFLVLLFTLCGGCSSAHVEQDKLASLRAGIAASQEQVRLALTEANVLARQQSISRVIKLNRPALSEKDFVGAVSKADIEKWDTALAVIDGYISALQYLTSPDRTAELEEAAIEFAEQLATGKTEVVVPPGVGAALTQLGKALVEQRANQQAVAIMSRTDSEVRQVLSQMALAVYDPTKNSGLRSTVRSNWETAINGSDQATPLSRWVAAVDANSPEVVKREIIEDFLTMVDARDAQLAALDRLRTSLLVLADAHTAAATGQPMDADALLALIERNLVESRAAYNRFKMIAEGEAASDAIATQPVMN